MRTELDLKGLKTSLFERRGNEGEAELGKRRVYAIEKIN